MSTLAESKLSPYTDAVRIRYDDGSTSLERVETEYIRNGNERIHTVMDGETLQSISYRYYKDSGLWYKIADANNIIDPFTEISVYDQLLIPSI